ncbi:hypothetical protein Pelo_1199 [Pelomyxa schiedti]|nr:hypothetical protein Pelo_1199 [Pelomyxa schiedti]
MDSEVVNLCVLHPQFDCEEDLSQRFPFTVPPNVNDNNRHGTKGGNLDVVKWVISKFHGSGIESWELPMPFRVALREGHLDVVEWMASSTDVVGACSAMVNDKAPLCNLGNFIGSPSLEVMQFCTDLFCGGDECPPEVAGFTVLKSFVEQNSMSSSPSNEADLEEVCDWIKKRFALKTPPKDYYLENAKAIKWFMKSFWVQPKPGDLHTACVLGDEDLIEWLMADFSESVGAVTPVTFIDACANKSVSFVKFLLPKTEPRLTRKQLNECLASSLSRNNTSVADWLEKSFHLMDKVNASPTVTNEVLLKLFSRKWVDGTTGIQWFLSHCVLSNIWEGVVIKGVEDLLQRGCISSAIILLDTFDVPPIGHCYWISNISVSQAKEVLSRGKFSLEHIADTFSACESPQSGKVVKWFVQQFHLDESEHVTIDNLLIQLMASNKRSCLEWFIRKFHVTLTQFGRIYDGREFNTRTSIDTWKMLMRVFPEMTASFAMEHLGEVVTATPLHIQASKKSLGITQADEEVNNRAQWNTSSDSVPPIISCHIHVCTRDQLLALATSSHVRCGASSPARTLASQPAVLRQLWESILSFVPPVRSVSLTSRPLIAPLHARWPTTTSIGVVVSGCSDSDKDTRQLLTFGVSRSLVGVVGPVGISPAWSPAQVPEIKRYYGDPQCVSVGNAFHVLEKAQVDKNGCIVSEYTLRQPQPPNGHGLHKSNGGGEWVLSDNGSVLSLGNVNSKWWVCCSMLVQVSSKVSIARVSRLLMCQSTSASASASAHNVCITLKEPSLLGFFFSHNNPDEAAMVTTNNQAFGNELLRITVIDVERTFLSGSTKTLGTTIWMIYGGGHTYIQSGMMFHNQTTGSRTFVVVTQRTCYDPQELFVVEEGTGSQRRLESPFQAVSQLNDTVFCVSLSSEYQMWEARVDRQRPLRRVSICSPDVVTAECGLLFHRTQGGNVINVTHASTGALILSVNVPTHSSIHISGDYLD